MNTKTLMVGALSAFLALSGCVAGDEGYEDEAVEAVGESEDALLGSPFIFMHSPLLMNAGLASASFAVRTAAPLGFIAVDGVGLGTPLGLTLGTLGAGGVITPLGISAVPIDAALLGSIRTSLAATPLLAGVSPLAVSAPLVTALPASLQANLATLAGSSTASLAAMQAGLRIALTPSITANALLFTGLPAITSPTTFILGASFPFAATSAQLASMSVFTSLAAQNASIRSALFPLPLFPGMIGPSMGTSFLL